MILQIYPFLVNRQSYSIKKTLHFSLKKQKEGILGNQSPSFVISALQLHHSTHARSTHRHLRFFFGFVNDETFCCKEHACY